MTKQENQCFRVHTYLKEHKGITGYSAFSEIGVYRLSSCIHRLRKRGIDIADVGLKSKIDTAKSAE